MRQLCSLALLGAALACAAGGWKDMTAAKGWVRVPIPKTAALNPENQWSYDAKSKILLCTGDKGHEMLRSTEEYKDFVLHVEWRFRPTTPDAKYNSGVFVRASENGEYFVQGQVGPGPRVWLFADYAVDGKKQRTNLRDQMTAEKVKPAGEWNTYEMTVKGSTVSLAVNGENTGSFDKVPVEKGYIGLEAEGFPIEFRNVKLKELK